MISCTEKSPVQFPARACAQVVGLIAGRRHAGGSLIIPSRHFLFSFSLPSSLIINKILKRKQANKFMYRYYIIIFTEIEKKMLNLWGMKKEIYSNKILFVFTFYPSALTKYFIAGIYCTLNFKRKTKEINLMTLFKICMTFLSVIGWNMCLKTL